MEWIVTTAEQGLRLDKFLAERERLGSRRRASVALDRGRVFVNTVEVTAGAGSVKVAAGDRVRVWMDRPGSARRRTPARSGDLRIVFEDDAFIVVDKPAGVLAVPLERKLQAPSVFEQLVQHFRSHGKRKPLTVHRIDRDTSGLVVFAKEAGAQAALKEQFKRRAVERVYRAVVYGTPDPPSGTWRDRLVWDQRALIQKETHPRDTKYSSGSGRRR
jgi:23S rRNA pseudouridine1911/1915/1917 synthase